MGGSSRGQQGGADRTPAQATPAAAAAAGSVEPFAFSDSVRKSFKQALLDATEQLKEQTAPLAAALERLSSEVGALKSQMPTSSPTPLTTAPTTNAPLASPAAPDSAVSDQRIAELEEQLRIARGKQAASPSEPGTSARGAVTAAVSPLASPLEAAPARAVSTPGERRPGEYQPVARAVHANMFPILYEATAE